MGEEQAEDERAQVALYLAYQHDPEHRDVVRADQEELLRSTVV